MNARNLERRILIAVQAPHPVRFGAVFLGNPSQKFFSAVLDAGIEDSSMDNRDSEFMRFMSWVKPLGSSGFAAWGTEMMAFLEGYLHCHFAGGWLDLCSFVDGMDGADTEPPSLFWIGGLETLIEDHTTRALTLFALCKVRKTIPSHPMQLPSLGELRY